MCIECYGDVPREIEGGYLLTGPLGDVSPLLTVYALSIVKSLIVRFNYFCALSICCEPKYVEHHCSREKILTLCSETQHTINSFPKLYLFSQTVFRGKSQHLFNADSNNNSESLVNSLPSSYEPLPFAISA